MSARTSHRRPPVDPLQNGPIVKDENLSIAIVMANLAWQLSGMQSCLQPHFVQQVRNYDDANGLKPAYDWLPYVRRSIQLLEKLL